MHIIVCAKLITDPEAPASAYKVDSETKRVVLKGIPPVISTFDESALEAALRIKDAHECTITVISAGRNLSKPTLIKCLAAGADQLILLEDSTLDNVDSHCTADILTAAIKKIGEFDLILTGLQAADTNAGIVGSSIAENLGLPSITECRKIEINDGLAIVERVVDDGVDVIEASLPVLVTMTNDVGELRSVPLKELLAAQQKPITVWKADELEVAASQSGETHLVNLFLPQRDIECQIIEGESEEEKGANLALRLKEEEAI